MFRLRRLRAVAAITVVLIQLFSVGIVPSLNEAQAQESFSAAVAPNRFIVTLRSGSGISAQAVASTYGNKPGVTVDQVYSSAVNGFAGEFTDAALTSLRNDPNVASVTPDYILSASAQTVPISMDRIDADLNPTKVGDGSGSVSVDVAVLDSGVYQHSDLNVVGGKDCVYGGSPYSDLVGHGTHVAGTIGAYDNGSGVAGVAPGARIYAVKVLDNTGNGPISSIICGLDYVAARSTTIEVVNMSLGGDIQQSSNSCSSEALHQAVCNVISRGVTVVVAAGNSAMDSSTFVPAQYNEVITVSAYNDFDGTEGALAPCDFTADFSFECDDALASFSNYGNDIDISAPGVDILSTATGGGTMLMSGTSMASPHVAGAAALIYAQQGRMSPSSVRARLQLTAEPGPPDFDADSYEEPMLNVAFLGKGKIVAPSTVKVGDAIQVRVGDFTPGTRAIFRFNGTYIGGDTIDDAGRGHRNYTIPNMVQGTYKVTVSNGQKTVSRNVTVQSTISIDRTSGPVGETVNVTLRGFSAGETVDVRLGTRLVIDNLVVSGSGFGTSSFIVPAMPGGWQALKATGNDGNTATVSFKVAASAWVRTGTPAPGAVVYISYRGFKASEVVTYVYDTQAGPVINTPTETASSTGSGDDSVTIPADSTEGAHYVWLMGNMGTKVRIPLTIGPAEEPTPTPSPEPSQTPEPTAEIPTEVPTEVPTDVPTEVPTDVPTEVPTEAPTEMPTEAPTEVPTETPTAVTEETPAS